MIFGNKYKKLGEELAAFIMYMSTQEESIKPLKISENIQEALIYKFQFDLIIANWIIGSKAAYFPISKSTKNMKKKRKALTVFNDSFDGFFIRTIEDDHNLKTMDLVIHNKELEFLKSEFGADKNTITYPSRALNVIHGMRYDEFIKAIETGFEKDRRKLGLSDPDFAMSDFTKCFLKYFSGSDITSIYQNLETPLSKYFMSVFAWGMEFCEERLNK
jgi:hypothetical protein